MGKTPECQRPPALQPAADCTKAACPNVHGVACIEAVNKQRIPFPAGVYGLETYRTHQASYRLFNFRSHRVAHTGVSKMQVKLNLVQRATQPGANISAAARRLNRGDVNLSHCHHRIERALGGSGIGDCLRQRQRCDLP